MVAGVSILCIPGAVILFFTMMFNGNDSVGSTTPSPTVDVMESTTVEGTIIDATMNTLSIVTDDGRILAFNTENVDAATTGDGLFIDMRVRIDYQGKLNDTSVEQNVVVHTIEMINGSTTTENQPEMDPTVEATDLPQPTSTPQPTPTSTPLPTPTQDPILAKAQAILDNMSIEEKVGQMFIARCPQTNAANDVNQYHVGGYILFGRDFQNKSYDEVLPTIQSYQDQASIPLLIGFDEEGGAVNRVSTNPNLRAFFFWSHKSYMPMEDLI